MEITQENVRSLVDELLMVAEDDLISVNANHVRYACRPFRFNCAQGGLMLTRIVLKNGAHNKLIADKCHVVGLLLRRNHPSALGLGEHHDELCALVLVTLVPTDVAPRR